MASKRHVVFAKASASGLADFRAAKAELSAQYLKSARVAGVRAFSAAVALQPHHNVVGVGIGEKLVDGKASGVRAILFLVVKKYPANQLGGTGMEPLPPSVSGLPTDVIETGVFHRLDKKKSGRGGKGESAAAGDAGAAPGGPIPNPRVRIRPAQPGCSIGFQDPQNQFVMAGTFGAVVRNGGGLCILSNNHVLANEDKLPIGSPIFQPGLLDGGQVPGDQIAHLTKAVPLQVGAPNQVDCAIARAENDGLVSKEVLYIGAPQGTKAAQTDMVVHKFGRTTSYTVGTITSIDTDVTVGYDVGQLVFQSQIIVQGLNGKAFSDAGDSGSLILERNSQAAVALLFAGSTAYTIANHIEKVLAALKVTLA